MEVLNGPAERYYECDRCGTAFRIPFEEVKHIFGVYYTICPTCGRALHDSDMLSASGVELLKLKMKHFDKRI